ncbi:MAG: hypothetical protein SVP26_03185 [Chloroflexota bacterium]|nr:hypothetical protein [Chloroflexota bacterium]
MALLEIVDIEVPAEAQAGQQISFTARVKNNSAVNEYRAIMMYFWDGSGWVLDTEFDGWLAAGYTGSFICYFTMPAVDSAVFVHAWRWEGDQWVLDDDDSKPIALVTGGNSGFELLDVVIVNPQVDPGEDALADVTWRNNSGDILQRNLRWDIRRPGTGATWTEGPWVYIAAYPWQTVTTRVMCNVPLNWADGWLVDAKLMLQGEGAPIWSGNDVYTVGSAVPAGVVEDQDWSKL